MKRIIFPLIMLLFLTACSKHTEVRDRTFVDTVTITKYNNFFDVTVTDTNGVYSAEGETLEKALENAELLQSQNMFFGHTDLIALNCNNYTEMLTLLLKSDLFSPNSLLCIGNDISKSTEGIITNIARQKDFDAVTLSIALDNLLCQEYTEIPLANKDTVTMLKIDNKGVMYS